MITDDELLLHHYRELEPADRARIGAALGADPELARRLHALVARLDAAAAQPEVPVPEQVQRRWQAALDRAAAQPRAIAEQRRFFTPLRLQMAATAVVVFALTLSFQKMLGPDTQDTVAASNPDPAAVDANAYANGLKWHLASTERRLASLSEASPEERAELVAAIIGQNRMYALAAERAGEPQLARVLRAFTPILESVAADDEQATVNGIAQLGFELRVMQARLGAGAEATSKL
jgi:hypothetical protein